MLQLTIHKIGYCYYYFSFFVISKPMHELIRHSVMRHFLVTQEHHWIAIESK